MAKLALPLIALVFILLSGGCQSIPPAFVIRQSSELATVVSLQQMEATTAEAVQLKEVAAMVHAVLSGDEVINAEELKSRLLTAINERFFESNDRLLLILLCQNVQALILEQLKEPVVITVPLEGEIVEFVLAATEGVQSGANLYIVSVRPSTSDLALRENAGGS